VAFINFLQLCATINRWTFVKPNQRQRYLWRFSREKNTDFAYPAGPAGPDAGRLRQRNTRTDTAVPNESTTASDNGIVNTSAQSSVPTQDSDVTDEIVTTQTYIDLYNRLNNSVVNIQVVGEGSSLNLRSAPVRNRS
jgi:hypothetical protein